MSLADRSLPERPTLDAENGAEQTVLSRTARQLVSGSVSMLGFWGAIALPVLYLPFLFSGIESARGLVLFLALLALHFAALRAGRGHRRADG